MITSVTNINAMTIRVSRTAYPQDSSLAVRVSLCLYLALLSRCSCRLYGRPVSSDVRFTRF